MMTDAHEMLDSLAKLFMWNQLKLCFLSICDSKLLVDVICGRAKLQHENVNPILERIVKSLYSILSLGWRRLHQDPVVWMPRAHNKVADGIADLTMARAESRSRRYSVTDEVEHCNVVIQTDGGRGSDHCAAASYVMGLASASHGS